MGAVVLTYPVAQTGWHLALKVVAAVLFRLSWPVGCSSSGDEQLTQSSESGPEQLPQLDAQALQTPSFIKSLF